VHKKTDLIKSR